MQYIYVAVFFYHWYNGYVVFSWQCKLSDQLAQVVGNVWCAGLNGLETLLFWHKCSAEPVTTPGGVDLWCIGYIYLFILHLQKKSCPCLSKIKIALRVFALTHTLYHKYPCWRNRSFKIRLWFTRCWQSIISSGLMLVSCLFITVFF